MGLVEDRSVEGWGRLCGMSRCATRWQDAAGGASSCSAVMGMQRAEHESPQASRRAPSPCQSARMRCQGALAPPAESKKSVHPMARGTNQTTDDRRSAVNSTADVLAPCSTQCQRWRPLSCTHPGHLCVLLAGHPRGGASPRPWAERPRQQPSKGCPRSPLDQRPPARAFPGATWSGARTAPPQPVASWDKWQPKSGCLLLSAQHRHETWVSVATTAYGWCWGTTRASSPTLSACLWRVCWFWTGSRKSIFSCSTRGMFKQGRRGYTCRTDLLQLNAPCLSIRRRQWRSERRTSSPSLPGTPIPLAPGHYHPPLLWSEGDPPCLRTVRKVMSFLPTTSTLVSHCRHNALSCTQRAAGGAFHLTKSPTTGGPAARPGRTVRQSAPSWHSLITTLPHHGRHV